MDEKLKIQRVPYDDLEYQNDTIFYFGGVPFSGIGEDTDEHGRVMGEVYFVDGKEHGQARSFYPSGNIMSETTYFQGVKNGVEREWYESGKLRGEWTHVYGICMEMRIWSLEGEVVESFIREPTDELALIARAHQQRFE
jgi:antitoxin component YwqK of YwqJK toxin-antitoxin module